MMSFGSSKWFDWIFEYDEALELIKNAYEAGVNFFDTANMYSNGESEIILGKAIRELNMNRNRIVVATKVFCAYTPEECHRFIGVPPPFDPEFINEHGLSRKHIFDAVDASLKRLGLDYIDLYQIHRMDPHTPWEETMSALHDLIKMGKIRYIGASSMPTWEFQKANYIAEKNGWTQFISMQNLYNLLYREEEREMIPYCLDQKVAGIPYMGLCGGYLTGKNRSDTPRSKKNKENILNVIRTCSGTREEHDVVVDKVIAIAENRGISPAQVALAWLYSKPFVTSPILGISKKKHIYEAIQAMYIELKDEEIQSLEAVYVPRPNHV
ncbi:NADP-dependent oxidoreductase domain-containing protein [Cunninghamella echinulata]|nr:NADP-dependent oxidoreductase domain-containing protein [Cunninghamella echinulata]